MQDWYVVFVLKSKCTCYSFYVYTVFLRRTQIEGVSEKIAEEYIQTHDGLTRGHRKLHSRSFIIFTLPHIFLLTSNLCIMS